MSDEDEVQYVKKPRNIHYGSLEETEKARLAAAQESANENNETDINPPQNTHIHISNGNINYEYHA